jgi:type II secretion system protein G
MNKSRKHLLPAVGVLVIAGVAAYWYWSPYLVMRQMRNAAVSADADNFNDHVDYPKLRESLKGQLSARIAGELGRQSRSGNEFERAGSALGSMLGLALVDKMVDAVVRPEMVMRAMENGKFQLQNGGQRNEESKETAAQVDISTLTTAVKLYKLDHGVYPTGQQGLQILVDPSAGPGSGGTYLDKLPMDPWGRPYRYASPGKDGADFEITYLPPPPDTADSPKNRAPAWRTERKGADKVFVYVGKDDTASKKADTAFVMRREGFANWKLTEIRLPE